MQEHFDLAIVAPFPAGERVREGWMSRIGCIDRILKPYSRLYVRFGNEHTVERDGRIIRHEPNGAEICLNAAEPAHRDLFSRIVDRSRLVYVHTVHLAEAVLDWLGSGKFIVDIHGIGPEEEILLGRPEMAERCAVVERQVLEGARMAVVVSRAMALHFREKYPGLAARVLHVPVYEDYDGAAMDVRRDGDALPVTAVYAGGIQVWQNLDAMLRLAQECRRFARFSFFSHDHAEIRQKAAQLCPDARLRTGFCEKTDLPRIYGQQQFGLVLRDDNPVNRVSCPTKLAEYLRFGVIPVVRCPGIGDFREYGYEYVQEQEIREGFFPDARTRSWMRQANLAALASLQRDFQTSARQLRELAAGNL